MTPRSNKSYPKLMGVTALLGEEASKNTQNKFFIPISSITLPASQPRRYFDPQKLEQLVDSIRKHGVLENLLVRPLAESNHFELVAGERRYRAALEAGLTEVPVTAKSLNDTEALEIALIENLQREDLNPIDETEGIIQLLSIYLSITTDEVISLLNRMLNEVKGKVTHNVMDNSQGKSIQAAFEGLGIMGWQSFATNRLPLLKLPDEILRSLRSGEIEYTKALVISRIKNKKDRTRILRKAIKESLSLNEIKALLKTISSSTSTKQDITIDSEVKDTLAKFRKSKIWKNPKKEKQVRKILQQLDKLLSEEN
ncbi:ParB/RepB/Spo0J family partition protein [Acaryochloris marina NIES-2412]|uniref:ParB/RepB/Spo0J family partition protein n=1 Tax=Acaryochloris marina TaxID=155978 RepID=UPI0040592BC5